jgi:hypothetical protein
MRAVQQRVEADRLATAMIIPALSLTPERRCFLALGSHCLSMLALRRIASARSSLRQYSAILALFDNIRLRSSIECKHSDGATRLIQPSPMAGSLTQCYRSLGRDARHARIWALAHVIHLTSSFTSMRTDLPCRYEAFMDVCLPLMYRQSLAS